MSGLFGASVRGVRSALVVAVALAIGGGAVVAQGRGPGDVPQPRLVAGDVLVTLSAKQSPLAEVIDFLRKRSGINIILAEGIDEKVSVDLVEVPWRVALEIVAERASCTLVQRAANVIRVEQPQPVTFDFAGADAKEVINAISRVSGASIIVSADVSGPVHMNVTNVPWRAALETVAKTLGAVVVEDGYDIYRVVKPESLQAQMVTRVFPIKYLRPAPPYRPTIKTEYATLQSKTATDPVAEFTLIDALRKTLTPTGSLEYFARNNTLVVKDIPPVVEEVERMLIELDREPAQVFIDVKFVTTTSTDSLTYGVDIGETGTSVALTGGAIASRLPFNVGGGGWNNSIVPGGFTPGLAPDSQDIVRYGTLDFTQATFTLDLLAQDQNSRVVQAPKLLALDNQEATIFVGRTVRFAETEAASAQSGGLTFSIKEASNSPVQTGFQLYLVPHVVPGTDKVIMTVIPEAEQLVGRSPDPNLAGFQIFEAGAGAGGAQIALPQVSSSTLVTTLMLESGQTAVIGGLVTEQQTETVRKMPFLGDIPVLGWLFKTESASTQSEALLIFITPRILRDSRGFERFIREEEARRRQAIEAEYEAILGLPNRFTRPAGAAGDK